MPGGADAAAFGVPHPVLGAVAVAVVVPRGELTVPGVRAVSDRPGTGSCRPSEPE
ncbi:AMP-binding enzyme [Streptomyces rubiginosohelvolus]